MHGAGELKKNRALFCQRVAWTYACIVEHQRSWPVSVVWEVLGVGRHGFDAEHKRQAVPALRRAEIAVLARSQAISDKPPPSDGSRRMPKQREDEGEEVGRCQGRRCMPQAGVSVEGRRRRGPKPPERRHG